MQNPLHTCILNDNSIPLNIFNNNEISQIRRFINEVIETNSFLI